MKKPFRYIALSLLSLAVFQGCEETRDNRPNVLFISVDDLNDWIEPLGGHPQARTPNLQKLSDQSITFAHAYCASPGCNPSRGAILTGMNPHTSGLYSNYQDWRKIPRMTQSPTLNRYFLTNGYYSAGAGKIYHYEQVDSAGWSDYFPSKTDPMPTEDMPDERPVSMPAFKYIYNMFDWAPMGITDEEMADFESVSYISEQLSRKHDKPFFLACGIYRPHLPWYVPQRYYEMFPLDSIQLPKVLENDTSDLGVFARKELIERGGNYHRHITRAGLSKNAVQGYLASVAFADAMVGRLINALDNSLYADNTLVVLWSDHGWQLGEKNHWRKFALWENVNRSVLMFRLPGQSGLSGIVDDNVSLVDIYPTLIDLCGLPARTDLDGQSLRPYLEDPFHRQDRAILTSYDYGSYSVRYRKWHYIRYIDESKELYNLESDPEEWSNLASKSELADTLKRLDGFIPTRQAEFPVESLIKLMEHHILPIQSRAHYESRERREWINRFDVP